MIIASTLTFGGLVALSGRLNALSQGNIGYKQGFIGTSIAQGVNNILPAKLGEAVKVIYLSRESRQPAARVFGLVFWERFIDLNVLLLLGLIIVYSTSSSLSMGALSSLVIVIWIMLAAVRLWPGVVRALNGTKELTNCIH